ncbi:MAG TPA: ATP-binding protein, partial [Candidatus Krumholzibacterium sp.]|nr:ATP-binding protein [Candidatus Krumholzibacterium sp.]
EVRFEAAPGDYLIRCDEKRLQQVFMNILINALQSTGADGSVTARLFPDGGSYVVEITDTGRGIPSGNMERVFEPFFTTRNDGSGLGLAVAGRITEEHGGRIRIESEEGRGTKVIVTLPAAGIPEEERDEQDTDSR